METSFLEDTTKSTLFYSRGGIIYFFDPLNYNHKGIFMDVKNTKNSVLARFSPHLFWDTDVSKLDVRRDKTYIIERVMNYGLETDEITLYKLYSFGTIRRIVTQI